MPYKFSLTWKKMVTEKMQEGSKIKTYILNNFKIIFLLVLG